MQATTMLAWALSVQAAAAATLSLAVMGVMVVTTMATLPMVEVATQATSVETAALLLATTATVALEEMPSVVNPSSANQLQAVLSAICSLALAFLSVLANKPYIRTAALLIVTQHTLHVCCNNAAFQLCWSACMTVMRQLTNPHHARRLSSCVTSLCTNVSSFLFFFFSFSFLFLTNVSNHAHAQQHNTYKAFYPNK